METRKMVKTIIAISYKLIVMALIVILIYYAGGAAFRFGVSIFHESSVDTASNARQVTVTIPDSPSVKQVASILKKSGLVTDDKLFYIQAMLSNYHKFFEGGEFVLDTSMKPTEIMEFITRESREKVATAEKEKK